ncbi:TIGR03943 family protein [Egicoccus sp. AB-alg2]|uniref:TIGR03943 family putative permease subunit n=1 Tax=Egicoccus sp. AB-alg2 TaxID=3242693 RepID=UPI00359CE0AB
MNREVQAAVLLVIGVVLARLTFSEAYLAFVKSNLRWPLIASAVVLVVLGVLSLVREHEDELAPAAEPAVGPVEAGLGGIERDRDRLQAAHGDGHGGDVHGDGHGHDHGHAPRIGLLMLVPVLALLLVAPEPLGAHAAGRGGANRVAEPVVELGPLPEPVDGVVPMTLGDTVVRALYEPDGPLPGTPVRLVGFVVGDDTFAGYRLSRFSVSCCAADASVRQVLVAGGTAGLPDDTWVEVVARFEGVVHDPDGDGGAVGIPVLQVVDERQIERPTSPYEY